MKLKNAIEDHLSEMLGKLDSFKDTGYSFEEWINWEFFYAVKNANLTVCPKPQYPNCTNERVVGLGDLLVSDKYFIEIASVHDYTGDKWIAKINGDRSALETLASSRFSPIQLLVLVSKYGDLQSEENWKPWLEKIDFWHEKPEWSIECSLPNGGQVVVKCWSIGG